MKLGHSERERKGVYGLGGFGPPQWDLKTNGEAREYLYKIIKNYTPCEKLGLKFTPPVIAISNSISICINKHTS